MPNAAHMHNKKQLLHPKPDNLKQEVMRGVKLRVQDKKMKNLLHEQVPSLTVSTCLLVFVCLFFSQSLGTYNQCIIKSETMNQDLKGFFGPEEGRNIA